MNDQARGELVPGGLALVHSIAKREDLNGRVVRLIEFGTYEVNERDYPVDAWDCQADWISSYHSDDTALFLPENLMPINPEADPLSIDQHQECEA